jgi:hypothetical protein
VSQVGRDVYNFGRVAADQVLVPGTTDQALSRFLPAWMPGSGNIETQQARTKQSESELSPEMAALARFEGQRLSVGGIARKAGLPGASPYVDAAITGGGGTLMHGDTNPWDVALNTGLNVGASGLSDVAGTYGAAALKKISDVREPVVRAASQLGQGALEDIRNAYQEGGDVAATAEQYARLYGGEIGDRIRRVAEYAGQPLDATTMQRAASGIGGYVGSKLAGGSEEANALFGLLSSRTLDPAMRAYNVTRRNLDVNSAIDRLYPTLAGATKTAVDPEAWRSAFHNLAMSATPTYETAKNAILNWKPASWSQ